MGGVHVLMLCSTCSKPSSPVKTLTSKMAGHINSEATQAGKVDESDPKVSIAYMYMCVYVHVQYKHYTVHARIHVHVISDTSAGTMYTCTCI